MAPLGVAIGQLASQQEVVWAMCVWGARRVVLVCLLVC